MTGSSAPAADPGTLRRASRGIGRAAVLIGAITVASRAIGFGRQLVFAHTVGSQCLGTAYATANQAPNIVYDIVLGGALSSVVVPVLAGPAVRGGEASRIASALLTWTVLLLAPVSLALGLAAGPVTSLLLAGARGCDGAATAAVSAHLLVVFAPQILLYGVAVVLYGILQAHHRFTAPALAPVLSSAVVILAYAAFVPLGGSAREDLARLPLPAELMLSVGTTAGVAALALTTLGPTLRLRLRLRPALRFPPGVAARARGLAAVGAVTLMAQDAALVAVIMLANGRQGQGALVLYNYGWQMFFVPYAVLAVPVATSAFPLLSAAADDESFDRTAAASTKAVLLASALGAGLLLAAAIPAARLFVSDSGKARELAFAFAAFAPGLIGYGLTANLSRVLFACRRSRAAALAMVSGWLAVIAADVAGVRTAPVRWMVPVLGLGNSIGLTLAGIALLAAVRAARGPAALRGSGRAAWAGLAGAAAAALVGGGLSAAFPAVGLGANVAVAALACLAAAAVFAAVVAVVDGGELRALAVRLAGRTAP